MASISTPISLPPPPPGWQHKTAVRYGDWNSIRHCAELAEKVKDQERYVDSIEKLLHINPTPIHPILNVILFVPAVLLWVSFLLIKNTVRLLKHVGIIPKPAPVPPKPLTLENAIKQGVKEALDSSAQRKTLDSLRRHYQRDCLERAPQETPVKVKATSAFWTTTPFKMIAAAQHVGNWIEETDRHLTKGLDAVNTQIVGAAAFVGLAAAAAYRLRFGDTSLLQRLLPAL